MKVQIDFRGLPQKKVWLQLLSVGALLCSSFDAYADPDEDPDPGPSVHAKSSSIPEPVDKPTTTNTLTFPSIQTRGIAAWPTQQQPLGALSGRIIYTNAGHGFHWVSGSTWDSDRPTYQSISEDLGNQDQMTHFVYHAFNAGATIVPMRPVGNQTNEVVMDNDHSGVTYFGTWTNGSSTPYFSYLPDISATETFYRTTPASASETAVARYTPTIPVQGYYPVYGWALDGTNRAIDQLYRIKHSGGVSEIRVNHRKVGKGWVYLGTYHFEAGTGGYCEISNQSSAAAGSYIIADAIRFGNGMGNIVRGTGVSSLPREEEASRYWIQAMMGKGVGSDTGVYDRDSLSDGSDNVGAPIRMAAYMNREGVGTMTDRVFLSFHSNGGGGRGAVGLWNNENYSFIDSNDSDGDGNTTERIYPIAAGTKTPNQEQLAIYQGREINLDMQAIGSPPLEYPWSTRGTHDYYGRSFAYGEMRWDTIGQEMDATINEVAFHDDVQDAALLGNSNVRSWLGRSAAQGLVRYFNQFGGGPLVFAPEPPKNVAARVNVDGTVSVSWVPPGTNVFGSGTPASYVVSTSQNGYGFGNPTIINGGSATQVVISNIPGDVPVYFRVSSRNAGGDSMPSEVIAVRKSATGANTTLIVNGFDRLDRAMSPLETNIGLTSFRRAKPWMSNNGDYVVQHAKALHAAGRSFDSSSNEAVSSAMLVQYDDLIWVSGEESTGDNTFNATEQNLISTYLADGKNLMVSGAEIGWDLDLSNNGRSFYRNTLGVTYVGDDAGTYNISGGSGVFSSVGGFAYGPSIPKNNTQYPPAGYAPYDADYADTLAPTTAAGASVLTYATGGAAAIRTVRGNSKIIVFGFPFECLTNTAVSANVMSKVVNDFQQPQTGVLDWAVY